MDGDLRTLHAEQRVTSVVEPAGAGVAQARADRDPLPACHGASPGRPARPRVADLAGCYDYDLLDRRTLRRLRNSALFGGGRSS
jgi:hypothetical protein